jgi:serine/threonine protein kinase
MGIESPLNRVPDEEMADTLLKGRYRHLAEIGRGEHTVVYKAHDTALDRPVVVKVLREQYASDPAFVEHFQRAARAMAALPHPNIVGILDIGSDRDLVYIVTEYVEGPNLETLLTSEGPLDVDRALDIAGPICDALGAAHRAGYTHGQLTPRNVLLTDDGQAKVSDFRVEEAPPTAAVPEQARTVYTVRYRSPEQLMGRRTTPASDVYSAGVILYEMLCGHPPFVGESYAEIAEQHIRREPEPLHLANPDVPARLSSVVHTALARTSTERYRSGAEMAEALRAYTAESGRAALLGLLEDVAPPERLAGESLAAETVGHPADAHRKETALKPDRGQLVDWTGCLLATVAIVAVLGLVPLWLAVFLRYFA